MEEEAFFLDLDRSMLPLFFLPRSWADTEVMFLLMSWTILCRNLDRAMNFALVFGKNSLTAFFFFPPNS
jgi:hypothetical protein